MSVFGVSRIKAAALNLSASLLFISTGFCAGPVAADEDKSADIMQEINEGFRTAYGASMKEDIATAGPVIIVDAGKVVLLRSGKRQESEYIPDQYRLLK